MLEAIGLAFGLAMDATAVAAARGVERKRKSDVLTLPGLFGVFQGAMVALGWAIGRWGGSYLAAAELWIAVGLLVLLGAKMIVDSMKPSEDAASSDGVLVYLGLALATSVDAAAAGLTLPLLPTPPAVSIALVGGITAGCSLLGYLLGRAAGARFGQRLGVLGGLVLIGLAVKLLVERLW